MEDEPLFEVEKPVPKYVREQPAKPFTWSRYTGPLPCDECKALQAQGSHRYSANVAKWKRKAGENVDFLCHMHAEPLRERDGVKDRRRKKK